MKFERLYLPSPIYIHNIMFMRYSIKSEDITSISFSLRALANVFFVSAIMVVTISSSHSSDSRTSSSLVIIMRLSSISFCSFSFADRAYRVICCPHTSKKNCSCIIIMRTLSPLRTLRTVEILH